MIRVESAREMLAACEAELPCDIFVACAAVADMRPKNYSAEKIKKQNLSNIELVENPDILATIAKSAQRPSIVIGFAAESQNHVANARAKLTKKSCDLIILNDTSAMGEDENEVWLVFAEGETHLPKASKDVIAKNIIKWIWDMGVEFFPNPNS
jgi:phosphopantothenoylcysteine decarboxylase/phosphopantothenate--cysteine ligase